VAASLGGSCNRGSWKRASIQRGHEPESKGVAIVGAATRQPLVKTLQAGKDLACALMIFKVCKLAMAL
jgi:hypothetical protein